MRTCPTCHATYPDETAVCPLDGVMLVLEAAPVAAPLPPDPLLGTLVADRYKITRRIGEGGMGIVYAAVHGGLGKQVAIKVLHDKYAERPELAARLMHEAQLASSIHHPNIIDIIDFGATPDGRAFVAMEFLEGESLAQLISREGALPEPRILALSLQIASALGAAHEKGIIHRDIKPENIFLIRRGDDDFVKVVDFGISKNFRPGDEASFPEPRLTQTGMVLGTPLYMSPEQARGEDDLDHRIDVYALGVIIYECLTGEVPFRGTNYLGIISQVVSQEPLPPRQVRPDLTISEACEYLVMHAIAKERDARYGSMSEFAVDLERVRSGRALDMPHPFQMPARRRNLLVSALAAVGLLVIVGGGVMAAWLANHRAQSAATPPTTSINTPSTTVPVTTHATSPPSASAIASTSVIVKINSSPAGAEILDGSRRLGKAPAAIELARSNSPVRLTFRLGGYDDGEATILPQIDGETINIELQKHKLPSRKAKKAAPGETAPNPY